MRESSVDVAWKKFASLMHMAQKEAKNGENGPEDLSWNMPPIFRQL